MPATISATLDKPSYAPGQTMTLTVTYSVPAESTVTVKASVAVLGDTVSTPAVKVAIKHVAVVDPDRTWTLKSDNGSRAVYTATA